MIRVIFNDIKGLLKDLPVVLLLVAVILMGTLVVGGVLLGVAFLYHSLGLPVEASWWAAMATFAGIMWLISAYDRKDD